MVCELYGNDDTKPMTAIMRSNLSLKFTTSNRIIAKVGQGGH